MGEPNRGATDGAVSTDPTLASQRQPGDPAAALGSEATLATPKGPGLSARAASEPGSGDYAELRPIDPTHYLVGEEIARGGMGRILAARDRRLGREVAIKELLTGSGALRVRFEQEARITARLQHPSIVSVLEAGEWPNGEPFYAMKRVTGESLDRAIAKQSTLAGRLSLLPNVIAVTDALAFAHSRRVIHRDLKPANVLVGEFGETVVIDWGLAKDLSARDDGPDGDGPAPTVSATGGQVTVAGSVMGTPAYMPLEQATGKAVDARADVYSLGAMLYHLLSGAPPYGGDTAQQTLARVMFGPPPPLRRLETPPPADLVAIVEKAMARDAAARYPTAKELAADLKRFQTGQLVGAHRYSTAQLVARWVRRHRTPVAVAAAALVVLAGGGTWSVRRVLREQANAQANRDRAEDLLQFMLKDLRAKLEPLGQLPLLAPVGDKAVRYYEEAGALDTQQQLRRAAAHQFLGTVMVQQGDLAGALAQLSAALAVRRAQATAAPGDVQAERGVAAALNDLGNLHRVQGELDAALSEYRESLAILDRAAARSETPELRRDRVVALERIGLIHHQRRNEPEALRLFRESQAVNAALLATDGAQEQWQQDAMLIESEIGDALLASNDPGGALASYRASMARAQKLAESVPSDYRRRRTVVAVGDRVAEVLRLKGDLPGALAQYREGLLTTEALTAHDPSNTSWQADLATSHSSVAMVLQALGDLGPAASELRTAIAITESLLKRDHDNVDHIYELTHHQVTLGELLAKQKDRAGAVAAWRAGLESGRRGVQLAPRHQQLKKVLFTAFSDLGADFEERGDWAAALGPYRDALAVARQMAADGPALAQAQTDLADALQSAADAEAGVGDAKAASTDYREALRVLADLLPRSPEDPDLRTSQAACLRKLGELLLAQGVKREALAEFRSALEALAPLVAADPGNAEVGAEIARLNALSARAAR